MKLALIVAAAAVLSGCCGWYQAPSCVRPFPIYDMSPYRVSGTCRAVPDRSWSCKDSYNCADSTTARVYF